MEKGTGQGRFGKLKSLVVRLSNRELLGIRIRKLLKGEYTRMAREHRELKNRLEALERYVHRENMRQQVNELRQRPKILLIGTAEHTNIGDSAIAVAMQKLLFKLYPEYYQMEFSSFDFEREYRFLHAIVNEKDIIFLAGGGNMGNRYVIEEEVRRRVVSDFPDTKIVIMPQTIHFDETEEGQRQLALSEKAYNRHPDLTIFTRGRQSYDFAKKHFFNARVGIMTDTAFALRRDYGLERSGVLLCLREDNEAVCAQNDRDAICELVSSLGFECERNTNMAQMVVDRTIRASVVSEELRRHASKQLVITDRLHGMIFAVLTGTPVVVMKSVDQKIEDYYETFLKDSNAVFYVGTETEMLKEAVLKAMTVKEPVYPILDKNPIFDLRSVIEDPDWH